MTIFGTLPSKCTWLIELRKMQKHFHNQHKFVTLYKQSDCHHCASSCTNGFKVSRAPARAQFRKGRSSGLERARKLSAKDNWCHQLTIIAFQGLDEIHELHCFRASLAIKKSFTRCKNPPTPDNSLTASGFPQCGSSTGVSPCYRCHNFTIVLAYPQKKPTTRC